MLDDREREVIKAVFEHDGRPWAKLGNASPRLLGEFLAHVSLGDKAAAEGLAQDLRAEGYDVKVRERVMRSDAADQVLHAALYVVTIATTGGGAIIFTNKVVKALNDLPDGLRKLRDKLRGSNARLELHEAFDLPAIDAWLDANIGVGGWQYDRTGVETKPMMGGLTIFAIPEEISGRTILLAVIDGEVQEEVTQLKRLGPKSVDGDE